MKVGDLVKFKTTHPPKPWTEKVFLVSECNTNHIKLVGANNYGPSDAPLVALPRELGGCQ